MKDKGRLLNENKEHVPSILNGKQASYFIADYYWHFFHWQGLPGLVQVEMLFFLHGW